MLHVATQFAWVSFDTKTEAGSSLQESGKEVVLNDLIDNDCVTRSLDDEDPTACTCLKQP